jgi:Fe-S oxidoreductase
VLLLRDPFSHYVDSAVEDSALALLEAGGYRTRVLSSMGAGAALISRGFLKSAERHARALVDELIRVDPHGVLPVVVLEPSELSAVREDFADLMPGMSAAAAKRLMAAQSVEQLLASSQAVPYSTSLKSSPQRVLFHPHCHEKAGTLSGNSSNTSPYFGMQLLQSCGYDVQLVDAGCCGMGGTFGYESEHYEISQKIGGLRLFPAIAVAGDAWVAATGGSCRLHIAQGTGRPVEHPLVLAARAMSLV